MIDIVTDILLEDHLNCATKSYRHLHGQTGQVTDYAVLCSRLEARHLASASQWLAAQSAVGGVSRLGGSRFEEKVTADAIILDAIGAVDGLETHFHAIERMPGDSQLGPFHYRPIRFCRSLQPRSADHLLLAFDAFILSQLQGICPDFGILFCGPMYRRIRVSLRTHLNSLAAVLTRFRAQSANDHEPSLVLNRHCDACEFKQLCRAKAVEADNLTLLKGMTSKEVAHQNSKGIFSVKQLSYTFRPRRPSKRQRQQFHHNFALQALALREKKVHVLGEPALKLPRTQVYFDIEGVPDRGVYYLIGALIVTGQFQQYHCFWADDENDQVAIFVQFAALLAEMSDWSLFHYGNYEVKALRRMLPRLPQPCQETLRVILANSVNVLSIVTSHVYFPTTSNGLKDVAGFLGFSWTSTEASGLKSVVWREQWEEAREEGLKEKLREYNSDDCSALRWVTEFIASIAAREAKDKSGPSGSDSIIYAGRIRSEVSCRCRFGRTEFCLPDFEFVNECAYFDYQRDKVSVRGGKRSNSTKLRHRRRRPLRAKANKYIEIRCKRCPRCNNGLNI
jgi:predicted RecB family nuclease